MTFALSMVASFLLPGWLGAKEWFMSGDYWATVNSAQWVSHLAMGTVYQANPFYSALPGFLLLLEIEDPMVTLKAYDDGQMGYSWSHIDPTIDELAKLVAKSAELATMNKTPNVEALQEIRQIAYQFIGEDPPEIQFRSRLALQTRLTEPWFCCAEPRSDQLVTIRVPLRFEDQGTPSSIETAADCPSC